MALLALLYGRIYRLLSAIMFLCLFHFCLLAQEANSYRTIASGSFTNLSIWEIYDGITWGPVSAKPGIGNDIYVEQPHRVTLTQNEEVKSIFINSDTGAGQKLNLNGYNLDIYGTLQGYEGSAPGTPAGSHNSTDWIGNSMTSTLTFKGGTRTIIQDGAWSGNSQNSNYSVIFDAGPGIELEIEEPFKALQFTIRSGVVIQKVTNVNTCSTFSFNTNNSHGTGIFGDFIIENGGILISHCNDNILFRSGTSSSPKSATLFDLQTGGTLILEGTNPRIEAANFQIKGKVIFRAGSATKSLPASTFTDAGSILTFHDLELQGNRNLQLPSSVAITGGLAQTGTGQFLTNNTHITFLGNEDQRITGFALTPLDLTVDKSNGEVILGQSLNVLRNLTMQSGKLNFDDNSLAINSSNSGSLVYQNGSWENLKSVTYYNSPNTFTPVNGTFPFRDRYQGGIRKVQLLGTHAGGNLTINYTEYQGAEYNSNFSDYDATPILYRLFSYFEFSGFNPSSNSLQLRISAHQLIVDDVDDLRIVGPGYAAPGTHIPGMEDGDDLWAIRELTFNDLSGNLFTVGSYRTLSILPLLLLDFRAHWQKQNALISFEFAAETSGQLELLRFSGNLEAWHTIAQMTIDNIRKSHFIDEFIQPGAPTYYQLKLTTADGKTDSSRVIRLDGRPEDSMHFQLYPNPYHSGKIQIKYPTSQEFDQVTFQIIHPNGNTGQPINLNTESLHQQLSALKPGLYFILVSWKEGTQTIKWVRH